MRDGLYRNLAVPLFKQTLCFIQASQLIRLAHQQSA